MEAGARLFGLCEAWFVSIILLRARASDRPLGFQTSFFQF